MNEAAVDVELDAAQSEWQSMVWISAVKVVGTLSQQLALGAPGEEGAVGSEGYVEGAVGEREAWLSCIHYLRSEGYAPRRFLVQACQVGVSIWKKLFELFGGVLGPSFIQGRLEKETSSGPNEKKSLFFGSGGGAVSFLPMLIALEIKYSITKSKSFC